MNALNCIIIDDEPIARGIIQKYCTHLPGLNVVACCDNAFDARVILEREPIDILFLDINMPVLNGLSFIKTLKQIPQVIFTTGYKEYAVDAFELDACDYLVKPFSIERFILAVDKARERLKVTESNVLSHSSNADTILFIKSEGKIYRISYDELLFAEAKRNYTDIVTINNRITTAMTFTSLEKILPKDRFIRIHRSFIINNTKISHIEGNRVFIGKQELPLGAHYRADFYSSLNS